MSDDLDPYYRNKAKREKEALSGCLIVAFCLVLIMLVVLAVKIKDARAFASWDPSTSVPLEELCPQNDPPDLTLGPCRRFNNALIYTVTGQDRRLRWTVPDQDIDGKPLTGRTLAFDLQILEFPPKNPQEPVEIDELAEDKTVRIWNPKRAGLYYMRIRACDISIPQDGKPIPQADGEPIAPIKLPSGTWGLCSRWANSFDPQDTDPSEYPRGFIIYVQLAPATGGVIE
jgi:hypothetical protein